MSKKRKGSGRPSRPRSGPAPAPAKQGSPYTVPAIVVVVVVAALVAFSLRNRGGDDGERGEEPTAEVPTPDPDRVESVWQLDPELAKLREEATVILERVVDRWTRDPDQPWMLMHGMLAWGPRHLTRDGDPAGVHLLDSHLEARVVAGRAIQVFPIDEPGGARIDAHRDQSLKTLVEMGIPDPRIQALVADAQWRFEYDPALGDGPLPDANEAPWSAQAFCQTAKEGQDTFVTHAGVEVNLDDLTSALVGQLEEESRFLDDIRRAGDTTYEKRRQGIFRYTCGGTHLFMGADACVAAGFGDRELSERLAYQMDLLFWRMRREMEAVDNALTQAPQMAPLLVEQRMKYLGHFLESEAKAELHGTFVPNDFHRRELVVAHKALYVTVQQLQDMGVFDRLDTFREGQYEYYLFTAGDACHALHAIHLHEQLEAQRTGADYVVKAPVYESTGSDAP